MKSDKLPQVISLHEIIRSGTYVPEEVLILELL